MIKKLSFFLVLFSLSLSLACSDSKKANSNAKPAANADVKKGVTPVADSEVAVIDTDFGQVRIELYSNVAPKNVARFKELAKEGYFNGIAFHRINQSVIQAGNADTKPGAAPSMGKEGDSGKPNVDAEFSDIPYDTGIVGAARLGNDVNSANSQFFIMLKRERGFDNNYTVFGKVIDGINTVMTISGVPREGERPNPPVRIKTVTIQPK
jgi:peptidyl-prolyl cis-trans isomerase B (cyclophilin B)